MLEIVCPVLVVRIEREALRYRGRRAQSDRDVAIDVGMERRRTRSRAEPTMVIAAEHTHG
jgi:hypothetical protein